MKFESSEALANHVKKVKSYLKRDGEAIGPNKEIIGKMNLEDLRNHFQAENRKFEDIQKEGLRAKESQLIAEVGDLKKEKHFLRQQRAQQEQAMHGLIKELEMKKDRELRAKIEREEIQKALKEIERTKVSALERDKRRELERLAAERENLRLKEEDVIDEIKNLENKLYEQERQLKEQRERKLNEVNNSEYYNGVMRKREIEFAKNRGEQIAILQQKKDNLEKDRMRIMEDLDKVKQGDFQALRKNEASRWAANDIIQKHGMPNQKYDITRMKLDPTVKDKLVEGQAKINNLKEQREKLLREALPELDELENLTKDYLKKNPQVQNQIRESYQHPNIPAGPQSYSPLKQNSVKYQNEPLLPPQQQYQSMGTPQKARGNQVDQEMLDKLRILREEYSRGGEQDPQFYEQLDELENHLLGRNPKQNQTFQQLPQPMASPQKYLNLNQSVPNFPPVGPPLMPPPVQFYPAPNQAPYIEPPPPPVNGGQLLERYEQDKKVEPPPQAQQPYLNPQINAMNQLIKEQEIQNEKLEGELLALKQGSGSFDNFEQMLVNSDNEIQKLRLLLDKNKKKFRNKKEPFPEDFVFRQNEFRSEDLEVEERALMNIAAQEYDALRLMSRLPVNSELYRYKMDQYKELSTMRNEVEKVLQEQRLEKIRRDFEKQKYEDERRFKHEKWLEEQKRQILEAKLRNAARQPQPEYAPPESNYDIMRTPVQKSLQQSEPKRQSTQKTEFNLPPPITQTQQSFFKEEEKEPDINDPNKYDPLIGMNVYFDFVARLLRQFRSMRIVYAVYNVSRSVVNPSLIDIHDGEPDPEDPEKNRIIFKVSHTLKNIQPHPSSNLIFELQVPKPGTYDKFISFGWTVINLFDNYYELNKGIYKLPIYLSPTRTDIDVRDMHLFRRIPQTILCVRVGIPGDDICDFQLQFSTSPNEYVIPRIHQLKNPEPEEFRPPSEKSEVEFEQPPEIQAEKERMKQEYECKGVQVLVHYVKQYIPPSHARVQCILYEGRNIVKTDDGKQMNWVTKPVDIQNVINTNTGNPLNAGLAVNPSGLARGEILAVEDETTWIKDLYKMQWDHNRDANLTLIIQVMEFTKGRQFNSVHEIKQDYQCIAYGVLQINNEDATIKYGTYEVELYKPPVNLNKRSQLDLLRSKIKVTIGQPHFTNRPATQNPDLPLEEEPKEMIPPKIPLDVEPPRQERQQPNQPPPNSDKPFIPNEMKQYNEQRFVEGEGIDFYIDGARFLPENVSYSRVLMRAFTIDQFKVINPTKGLADLDISKGRHPFYGFRQEIRAQRFDPTIVVMIQIETIDRSDGSDRIVGYAYFPLFLNANTKKPCVERNNPSVILQTGSYQIPLYMNKLPVDRDISIENVQMLEKIPCSSVLVRVYKAPVENGRVLSIQDVEMNQWKQKGLIVDPPDYQDGVYNTSYCNVSQFEMMLFDIKNYRYNPAMREVVHYLESIRGKPKSINDAEIIRWLDKQLATNQQTPTINYRFYSQYEPRFGFRFGVERIYNIQQKLPHIAITSIAPAGQLYKTPPIKTPDAYFFTEFNWDSPWNSIQFMEDYINYTNLPGNHQLGFIIDIKGVKISMQNEVQLVDVGWTFLPIFDILENENQTFSLFTNSGLHQLPLWSGPVQKELVWYACKSDNPYAVLRSDKSLKLHEQASVIARIHDNQREWLPNKGFYGDLSTYYLPQGKLPKYIYQEQRERAGVESVKFNIPPGLSRDEFKQKINQGILNKYGF